MKNALTTRVLVRGAVAIIFASLAAQARAKCDEQAPTLACAKAEYDALDKDINAAYKHALTLLPETSGAEAPKGREQLKKSQRVWLQYKEEHCEVVGGQHGGSEDDMSLAAELCEVALQKERLQFLKGIHEVK